VTARFTVYRVVCIRCPRPTVKPLHWSWPGVGIVISTNPYEHADEYGFTKVSPRSKQQQEQLTRWCLHASGASGRGHAPLCGGGGREQRPGTNGGGRRPPVRLWTGSPAVCLWGGAGGHRPVPPPTLALS